MVLLGCGVFVGFAVALGLGALVGFGVLVGSGVGVGRTIADVGAWIGVAVGVDSAVLPWCGRLGVGLALELSADPGSSFAEAVRVGLGCEEGVTFAGAAVLAATGSIVVPASAGSCVCAAWMVGVDVGLGAGCVADGAS
jgi:hypothetical protein